MDLDIPATLQKLTSTIQSQQVLVQFLFGVFCAYWAQEKGRNPWAWFFAGLIFAPITGLVLLSRNAKIRRGR
jgi:hypothetical protein